MRVTYDLRWLIYGCSFLLLRIGCALSRIVKVAVWIVVAVAGGIALATIALHRGEPISATWFVVAAACFYAVAYRFYSAFIAAKLLALFSRYNTGSPQRGVAKFVVSKSVTADGYNSRSGPQGSIQFIAENDGAAADADHEYVETQSDARPKMHLKQRFANPKTFRPAQPSLPKIQ